MSEGDELLARAVRDRAQVPGRPARDELLDKLAASFLRAVQGPPPVRCQDGACWVVARRVLSPNVVVLTQDGAWRVGSAEGSDLLAVQLEAISRYSLPLHENIAASMAWYDHEASVRARSWNNPADGVPDPGVVPQRLADALAEQLDQAARRAARLAAARPGEPSDVAAACRQVVAVLARALAAAGHPGAAEMPMASQGKPSRFGKKRAAPLGYLLDSREGHDVHAALDGSLMAASIGPIEHAALLYRYAARRNVRIPSQVPAVLCVHPSWAYFGAGD